jgi:hypothetical protein
MKSKQQEKTKRATRRPMQGHWHEMNRKQRREMMRKIQADDLSLEVCLRMPLALISATNPTMWPYHRDGTVNRYVVSGAPRLS